MTSIPDTIDTPTGSLRHRRRSSVSSVSAAASSAIREAVSEAVDAVSHTLTMTFDEAPDWMKDNEYIRTGYRRVQNSWKGCFESIFLYFHNESVNIHTHFWTCIALLTLLLISLTPVSHLAKYPSTTWLDGVNFFIFLVAGTICMGCSALFHMSICHSEPVAMWCGCADYCGIIALIVGSFFPCVYYAFFCHPMLQVFYLSGITIFGAFALTIVLAPRYATPEYRTMRTLVFVALGLWGCVPVGHAVAMHGLALSFNNLGVGWLLLSAAFYLVGAAFYANRLPERFYPGKFDYLLASHQIFHVLVVAALVAHYYCIRVEFEYWHGERGGSCASPITAY